MLASGAHVKIGDKEFRLKFDVDGAYSYSLNSIGEQVDYWLMDDWGGGEGGKSYDPLDEGVYYQGLCNPRNPGRLTTPPAVTTTSSSTPTYAPFWSYSVVANNRLYLVGTAVDTSGYTHYPYTTDYSTISYVNDTTGTKWNTSVDTIIAACTDGSDVYFVGQDNRGGSPSYSYEIRRLSAGGTSTDTTSLATYAAVSNSLTIAGAAIKDNYVYTWNGNKLMEWDVNDTWPVTAIQKKKIGAGLSGLTLNVDYFADIINAEDSLFFFLGLEGQTTIFERERNGAISEVWNLPTGFTGRGIGYSNGALLVAGDYNSQSCVFGMSTISRQPIFLGYVRPDSNVTLHHINPGYGAEVIIGERGVATSTHTFLYDISTDAFSELDSFSITGAQSLSGGVFKGKRFQVCEDGTDWHIKSWDYDDVPSTTVNGRMETGVWDMDLPEDEKQLDGFHILSDANSTKTVDVYYQDNEDGTWTLAGTATTGFHNYIQVSDATTTVKFRSLRFRVDPKTGASVYAASARIRVNTYEEVWELVLDLTDEETDQSRGRRKRSTSDKGHVLRDYIRTIATNKTVVTFLDGARYPQGEGDDPDKYSTHTCIVDIPVDRISQPGEGTMLVRLRSVGVN